VFNFVKESNPAVFNHNTQANQNANGNVMEYSALQRYGFYH